MRKYKRSEREFHRYKELGKQRIKKQRVLKLRSVKERVPLNDGVRVRTFTEDSKIRHDS